ncbi:MAG: RDD family protein, partial [Solirubrobacteraceae bacterium]
VAPPPGYTSPAPPGAGGPAWQPVGGPAPDRPVLAGWWSRVGAQVIDGLIVTVGAGVLFVAITAPFSIGFFASDEVGVVSIIVGALLAVLCIAVVALLYAPALMARTDGKTLGRQVTGIRVIRTNGQPIDFRFALVREVVVKSLLVGVASTLTGGLAYLIDVLWPLWDEENRALHDFVVNTRTIVD